MKRSTTSEAALGGARIVFRAVALLATLSLFATGCQTGAALRAESDTIQNQLNAAREVGAYRCSPKELAKAESHLEFLQSEIDQGNWVRASAHRDVARENLVTVLEKAKGCKPEPTDRDGDTVLDENDACPDTPGPVELLGCPDTDGDGVLDKDDECVEVPGPPDNKGCPYGDKDQDGVLDKDDQCIDVPGPADNAGCPYGDRDKDGVMDKDDKCIDVPGPVDNAGCPYGDKDQDGVMDKDDECIDVPGPVENKGCPWGDQDKDGILDKDDKCPADPEDKDGWEDEDGCPDPDNDGDGIVDAADKCPMQPETVNDFEDEDGCPDVKLKLVNVNRDMGKIEIKQKVFFETGKAVIKSQSFELLNEVAMAIKANPGMKVLVEGHTDSVGSNATNQKLSDRRAGSVRDYLVAQGVDSERLTAKGFGEDRPIDTNRTKEGRSRNRRVEFTIVEP